MFFGWSFLAAAVVFGLVVVAVVVVVVVVVVLHLRFLVGFLSNSRNLVLVCHLIVLHFVFCSAEINFDSSVGLNFKIVIWDKPKVLVGKPRS